MLFTITDAIIKNFQEPQFESLSSPALAFFSISNRNANLLNWRRSNLEKILPNIFLRFMSKQ